MSQRVGKKIQRKKLPHDLRKLVSCGIPKKTMAFPNIDPWFLLVWQAASVLRLFPTQTLMPFAMAPQTTMQAARPAGSISLPMIDRTTPCEGWYVDMSQNPGLSRSWSMDGFSHSFANFNSNLTPDLAHQLCLRGRKAWAKGWSERRAAPHWPRWPQCPRSERWTCLPRWPYLGWEFVICLAMWKITMIGKSSICLSIWLSI